MNNTKEKPKAFDEKNINHVFDSGITNDVLFDLQQRGFNYLFKLQEKCIYCKGYNIGFDEFDIVEVHSLETKIAAEYHVVYAIDCNKYDIKGIIINPFENYANPFLNICLNKILHNKKIRFEYHNN